MKLKQAQVPKSGGEFLEGTVKPKLIENAKLYTSPILRLSGSEDRSDPGYGIRYDSTILLDYLRYFSYVIFVDYGGRLHGFSNASEISNEINKNAEFVSKINRWELDSPVIRKNAYVEEHTSKKQVWSKMQELLLDILPVVSEGRRYVGVTQKDVIIMNIVKDLYARYVQS
jgi:hypothetical protein